MDEGQARKKSAELTAKGVDGIAKGEDAASGRGEAKVPQGLVATCGEASIPLVVYHQVVEGAVHVHCGTRPLKDVSLLTV